MSDEERKRDLVARSIYRLGQFSEAKLPSMVAREFLILESRMADLYGDELQRMREVRSAEVKA